MEEYYVQIIAIIHDYLYLILPLIGALIGWFTNYLAVKMLFRPRKQINLLILKLQGVIPKRQKLLAEKIGGVVSQELLSQSELGANLETAIQDLNFKEIIVNEIDRILLEKLPQSVPMATMFLNNEIAEKIKTLIAGELESTLESTVNSIGKNVADNMDVKALIEEKIANFSPEKLEELVLSVMKKELRFIEFFGGLIGFMIGLVQVFLVEISNY